jgi:DNA-binding MarR family transcriptional regulator
MSTATGQRSSTALNDDELERLSIAWEHFIEAVRRGRARYGERLEDGLTLSQYEFVRPLVDSGGLPVGQLADRAGIAAATATQILDGLERSGIIQRSRTAKDRRTVTITLTEEGRRRVENKSRNYADQRQRLFESVPPEERPQAERLLRHLAETIPLL